MDTPVFQIAALVLVCAACEPQQTERTQELVDDAARTAEKAARKAEKGVEQGVEQARKGVEQGRRGVEKGVAQARQEIGDARERYDVDERVADAQKRLSVGMDEAAASFSEFADASRAHAEDVSAAIDEKGKAGIEGAAEAIRCAPDPNDEQTSRCQVGEELLAKLQDQPKLLAREIMLLPKRGETGEGLELVRLRPEGISDLLGFSRSDILLELNGISLGSLDAIRQVDEALRGKSEAEFVFERDGERKTVVIEREPGQ